MPDSPRTANPRVAVYIDFDNVVISRYDQVHAARRDAWRADNARLHAGPGGDPAIARKLEQATVDVGALLDYSSSFGRVGLARAYADWSVPANAAYRHQLVNRAVDLVQLFPVSGTKNGADIRLSVDAIADLMQYDDITHVVLVAGDSDYIALAQRCKQLGRYVIGIGVSGSTSRALVASCDEFSSYDALPGVPELAAPVVESEPEEVRAPDEGSSQERSTIKQGAATKAPANKAAAKKASAKKAAPAAEEPPAQREATELLVRALRLASDRAESSDEWLFGGGVKSQMQRMDAGFKEKSLGFKTFSAFVESRSDVVESRIDPQDSHLRLRLRQT